MSKICLAAETVLLAFQNYILVLGTSVMIPSLLVPVMGGNDVRVCWTTTYHFCSNSKVFWEAKFMIGQEDCISGQVFVQTYIVKICKNLNPIFSGSHLQDFLGWNSTVTNVWFTLIISSSCSCPETIVHWISVIIVYCWILA